MDQFAEVEPMLNNTNHQREDNIETCQLLKRDNTEQPRIPGMSRSITLTFWQPVAIRVFLVILNSGLKAAVLAEMVGLRKTFIILGVLLHVSIPISKVLPYADFLEAVE